MFKVYFNVIERPKYKNGDYSTFEEAVSYVKGWLANVRMSVPSDWDGKPFTITEGSTIEIREEQADSLDERIQKLVDRSDAPGAGEYSADQSFKQAIKDLVLSETVNPKAPPSGLHNSFLPVTYVRAKLDNYDPQPMGPISSDHPIIGDNCLACSSPFSAGDILTLVILGPGDDEEAQDKAVSGGYFNAKALAVHWSCATGERDELT